MAEATAAGTLAPAAFADILTRYRWPLYVFVRNLVADDEQAHDLVQDSFCDAWRAALKAQPPLVPGSADDEVRRWLFHTAYCRAVSVLRRRRLVHWQSLDDDTFTEPAVPDVTPIEDQVIEAEVVRAALAALAPDDAACLLLSIVHGFTVAEIAQVIGISFEAAKKRLSRAKQRLRVAYFAQNPSAQERQGT